MNPNGHNQGQNTWPIARTGEMWLDDIQSRLIFTREGGGTVIPNNGDMPFHVNNAQVDQYFARLAAIAQSGRQAEETLKQLQSMNFPANHPLSRLALPAPPVGTSSPGPAVMTGDTFPMGGYTATHQTAQSASPHQPAQTSASVPTGVPNTAWNHNVQTSSNVPQPSPAQNASQYSFLHRAQGGAQVNNVSSYQALASAGSRLSTQQSGQQQQQQQQQQRPVLNASASNHATRTHVHGQPQTHPMSSLGVTSNARPVAHVQTTQHSGQTGGPSAQRPVNQISGHAPTSTSTSQPSAGTRTSQGTTNSAQTDFGMVISRDRRPTGHELQLDLSYLSRLHGAENAKKVIIYKLQQAGHHDLLHTTSASRARQSAPGATQHTHPSVATASSGFPAASTTPATALATNTHQGAAPTVAAPSAPMPSGTPQFSSSSPIIPVSISRHTDSPSAQANFAPPPSAPAATTHASTAPAMAPTTTATPALGPPAMTILPTPATAAAATANMAAPAQDQRTQQAAAGTPATRASHLAPHEQNHGTGLVQQLPGQSTSIDASGKEPAMESEATRRPPEHVSAPPEGTSMLRDPSRSVLKTRPDTRTLARDIIRSLQFGKAPAYPPGRSTPVLKQNMPSTSARNASSSAAAPTIAPASRAPLHSQFPLPTSGPQGVTMVSPGVAALRHDHTTGSMHQAATGHISDRSEAPMEKPGPAAQPNADKQEAVSTGPSSRPTNVSEESRARDQSTSRPPSGAIFMDLITPDPSPPQSTHSMEDVPTLPDIPSVSQRSDEPEGTFQSETQPELHDFSYTTRVPGAEAAFGYISPRDSPPLEARITEVEEDEDAQSVVNATSTSGIVEVPDVDMDASTPAPQPPSSTAPSATPSMSTVPRKRNRAYVDLPPLPAHLRVAHRRMLKKARLEEAEADPIDALTPEELASAAAERARQKEREAIIVMASEVLGEFPCEWEDCDALLNSVRTLFKHFRRHLEREAESTGTEEVNCRWQRCTAKVHLPLKMQHISVHAPRALLCPYADCGGEFNSDALVAHVKAEHNKTQRRLQDCMPRTHLLGPTPEPLVNGVYFPRIAQPAVMSQEYRQELGPWVLRQIHSASRYAPTRKNRSRASEPLQEDVWDFMDEVETHDNQDSSYNSVDLDDLHDSLDITRVLQEGGQVRIYREDEYDTESEGEDGGETGTKVEGAGAGTGTGESEDGANPDAFKNANAVTPADALANTAVDAEGPSLRERVLAKAAGTEDDPLDLISSGSRDSDEGDIEMVDNLLG
ncbi:hypothetical protein PENSPDRAFT_651685 [Peniophora sp. CONT]|nr:hypothetical protein PENSPDRAFT_651685 [Peniophora sp. CONT]